MTVVVKPAAGKGKGYVILTNGADSSGVPTITLEDGTVINGKYINTVDEGGGPVKQYQFPTTLYEQKNIKLTIGGKTQTLKDGKQSYEGSAGNLQPRAKGSIGPGGEVVGGGGLGGANMVGNFGVAPQDISGEFPKAVTIESAPYNFTNPEDYAKKFGAFNLEGLSKNSTFAKGLALDALDTELQGLKGFAPAAAALKRDLTAQDNTFNQAQRTAQINTAIPDVLKDLNQQAADARVYASGHAPNSVVDRGLSIQDHAAAADQAAQGGFGTQSSAARSISDLMSAKDRIGLSQYGNSLLASNAAQRTELELAPTEYSNAGQQISVNPTISGSQLQQSIFGATNAATLISPEAALNSTTQQNQFMTTNQNAVNQFNAGNLNNFALSLFNYKAGLANSVASAGQVSVNTGLSKDDQTNAKNAANDAKNKTQKANNTKDVIGAVGSVAGGIAKVFFH